MDTLTRVFTPVRRRGLFCFAATLCLCLPADAFAHEGHHVEPEPEVSTAGEPPAGFFARASIGIGFARLDTDGVDTTGGQNDFEASGFAIPVELALGYSLLDDLALHVTVFGAGVLNAQAELGGVETSNDTTMQIAGAGAGVSYYVPKLEIFLSFSFGLGWTLLVDPDVGDSSFGDLGFASEVVIGKDFLLNERLGLGFGANAIYARVSGDGTDYNGLGGGLLASLTYR